MASFQNEGRNFLECATESLVMLNVLVWGEGKKGKRGRCEKKSGGGGRKRERVGGGGTTKGAREKEREMSMTMADLYKLHVKCCQQNWSLVIGAMSLTLTLEFPHPEQFDCADTFVLIIAD